MDMSVLRDYPAYAEFRKRTKTKTATGSTGPLEDAEVAASPEDLLGAAVAENRSAGPARSVPLPALVNGDFSFAALRQAAQRGRLDAVHGRWDLEDHSSTTTSAPRESGIHDRRLAMRLPQGDGGDAPAFDSADDECRP